MDRRLMVWPRSGTGENLARLLSGAASGVGALHGPSTEMPEQYLAWATRQMELLEPLMHPSDLERLIGNRRYWATLANPAPSLATMNAVHGEIRRVGKHLDDTAAALRQAVQEWTMTGSTGSYVLIDTSTWLDLPPTLDQIDWHGLITRHERPGDVDPRAELRLVIPILLVDELDGVSHRRGTNNPGWKASNFARFIYDLLGEAHGGAVQMTAASDRGRVTAQLLLDPLHHRRKPNNDEEMIDRFTTLRRFIDHPAERWWYLTSDSGAALRAADAGVNNRLIPKPDKP